MDNDILEAPPINVARIPSYKKEQFTVLEMTCAACAVSVESILQATEGVKKALVNFANHSVLVEYDPDTTNAGLLKASVQSIGYDLLIETENLEEVKEEAHRVQYQKLKTRTIWASVLSAPIVIIGMFFMDLPYGNLIMMGLSIPVIFYFGRSFYINAYKQAIHNKANMDTLVALSTGIAFLFSCFNTFFPEFWHQRGLHAHVYFEAATVIIAFISLGKLLEEKAKSNTSSAIKKLIGLQPKTVRVIIDGEEAEIPVSQVQIGQMIIVKPGERIPVDGVVSSGSSFIDESMVTGEPIAVEKNAGANVFAGTINQKGSFRFVAEKVGSDTMLAQIIKMVQEAQGSKAPVQKLVDKISSVFVPVVIGISILTFISWFSFGGEHGFTHALLNAVTVLVIACPCALGLATPTAIMVGIGKGAEHQMLVRDAESLETAHRVNAVILDKTGTITEGRPVVTDMFFKPGTEAESLKSILFGMELLSEHPLAVAVTNFLKDEGVQPANIHAINSLTGKGLEAMHNGTRYLIGNPSLHNENGIIIERTLSERISELESQAKTVVVFAEGQIAVAVIAIADRIKSSSKEAIQKLMDLGIEVYMLTGDSTQTAAAVAEQAGIKHFFAGVLPDQKADFVKKLQAENKVVAMVGDGINDSQALAQADVSIAMGKGSDIAIDVAKITLITSDLKSIPKVLNLSRKTVATIRQNLFWAFIYNLIGIPIAAGVLFPINGFLLDPMIAGAAMALSSVSVVSNSLRLKMAKL